MANPDARFGLKPIKYRSGAPYNGAVRPYYVPSTYGTALYINDAVTKTGTSNTVVATTANGVFQPATLPEVNKTTAGDGNAITGVIVAIDVGPTVKTPYKAANVAAVVWLADDPNLVFHIRDDGVTALDATSVGLNAVLINTHAGSADTGLSGTELDTASDVPAADASNQLTILRLAAIENNELGTRAIWEVSINQHTELSGAIGI